MFDFLMLADNHAIAVLKKDHDRVKELFDEFEKAEGRKTKEKIIVDAITELKVHTVMEEELFYPAVRRHVGTQLMDEADEEHHVAKVLIAELEEGGSDDGHRDAKFNVLAENVRHHIKEEEGNILPAAKEIEMDFEAMGEAMLRRKKELLKDGIPSDAEHAMVAKRDKNGHSTSTAAGRRKRGSPAKRTTKTGSAARRRTRTAK